MSLALLYFFSAQESGHDFSWQWSSPLFLPCFCSKVMTYPHTHTFPQNLSSLAFDSSSCFLPLARRLGDSWFYSLCTVPVSCSVVIHCYDLTAHVGAGDPDVYPALLSSAAKNSTAFSWILCWEVGHQSVLVIHTHPSSCRHCQPLLLFLRPIPSSSSVGEPTIYPFSKAESSAGHPLWRLHLSDPVRQAALSTLLPIQPREPLLFSISLPLS